MCVHMYVLSHIRLYDPMDCSPQGSSVHEIFQAGTLEWVAISYSNIYVFIPQKSIAKCSNRIIITDVGLIIFKFYLFLYQKSPIVHINFYIKDQ